MVFDAVYSSPLQRAYETANIICGNAPIARDFRLREIHHGAWQGKTKHEIALDPGSHSNGDAESIEQVRARVADFLRTVDGKRILCVTHGVVIQTLRSILLNIPHPKPYDAVPANGSVHAFAFHDNQVTAYGHENPR